MILLLPQFPSLYPDELLYSGIARYHLMSGNPTQKHTIQDLFGNRLACATIDLPSHLGELSTKMDQVYSAEALIYNNTLFPYYKSFIPFKKVKRIYRLMVEGSPWGEVHTSLGLASCIIKSPQHLKFCRDCYTEDLSHFSEPYWHRIHQVPGVYLCPIHEIALTETEITCASRDHKFEFVPLIKLDNTSLRGTILNEDWMGTLVSIAKQSFELIKYMKHDEVLNNRYLSELNKRGYVTEAGKLRFAQLMNDFSRYFSKGLLEFLNCDLRLDKSDNWIQKLLRGKDLCFHPLRHLLLHAFLNLEVNGQVESPIVVLPFGMAPWPCLNKAADHYMKHIINECKVTRCSKSGKPIGTFNCSCGFVYARKGPDQEVEDKFRIGRIKSFGQEWIQKLKQLNLQSISLRSKAALLGVDPGTVKNQTDRFLRENPLEVVRENIQELFIRQGRFLCSIHEAKEYNVSFRQLNPRDYIWLYRHDRIWLLQTILEHKKSSTKVRLIFDWKKRDEAILPEIEGSIQIIKNASAPQRITIVAIARNIVKKLPMALEKSLHKLPLSQSFINAQIETTEQFQVRRLDWAALELKERNLNIQGWKLLKVAGLNKPLRPEVQAKFNELILYEDELYN